MIRTHTLIVALAVTAWPALAAASNWKSPVAPPCEVGDFVDSTFEWKCLQGRWVFEEIYQFSCDYGDHLATEYVVEQRVTDEPCGEGVQDAPDAIGVPPRRTKGECLKRALVFNGNDAGNTWAGLSRLNQALQVADWLSALGYRVTQEMNYHPWGLRSEAERYYAALDIIIEELRQTEPGADCHHELFLYYKGHGSFTGWDLHLKPSPVWPENNWVHYRDLWRHLRYVPDTTVVTMLIDTCSSQSAFEDPPGTHRPESLPLITGTHGSPGLVAGLHVMTSASVGEVCPTGLMLTWTDSATEDFLEAASTSNPAVGNFGDRFDHMDSEGVGAPTIWSSGALPSDW